MKQDSFSLSNFHFIVTYSKFQAKLQRGGNKFWKKS